MTINFKAPEIKELQPRLLVLGVGGAGGNAINEMIDNGMQGVEFVAVNTDAQDLKHSKAKKLINMGLIDVYRYFNKSKQEYTFWDYFAGSWQKNYGMRIDHFLISNSLINNAKSIKINKKPRSKIKPSDHTPIELEIT